MAYPRETTVVGCTVSEKGCIAPHGVDDNGSGVAVLLESALRMRSVRPPYTIRYVFFGAEETGMNGSRAYVEALSQEEKENLLFIQSKRLPPK